VLLSGRPRGPFAAQLSGRIYFWDKAIPVVETIGLIGSGMFTDTSFDRGGGGGGVFFFLPGGGGGGFSRARPENHLDEHSNGRSPRGTGVVGVGPSG